MWTVLLVSQLLAWPNDPQAWPNVLEPTEWLFDQGSQYGYRAVPSQSSAVHVAGGAVNGARG